MQNKKGEKIRKIEDICEEEYMCFQTQIGDFKYCSLAMRKGEIECPYLSEKDDNGFHLCGHYLDKEKSFN